MFSFEWKQHEHPFSLSIDNCLYCGLYRKTNINLWVGIAVGAFSLFTMSSLPFGNWDNIFSEKEFVYTTIIALFTTRMDLTTIQNKFLLN